MVSKIAQIALDRIENEIKRVSDDGKVVTRMESVEPGIAFVNAVFNQNGQVETLKIFVEMDGLEGTVSYFPQRRVDKLVE